VFIKSLFEIFLKSFYSLFDVIDTFFIFLIGVFLKRVEMLFFRWLKRIVLGLLRV